MDGFFVPAQLTPLSPDEAILALDKTWTQIALYSTSFPQVPEISSLAVLMGIWAWETNWGREMWNHNWTSLAKMQGDRHNWTTRINRLNISGAVFTIREDVRAYESLADGALGFLLSLSTPPYGIVWQDLKDGNAREVVESLQEMGFFGRKNSANRAYYIASTADRIRFEHPTRPDFQPPGTSEEDREAFKVKERQRLLNLVALSLWTLMEENND